MYICSDIKLVDKVRTPSFFPHCFSLECLRIPHGTLLVLCFTDVAFAAYMVYDVATFYCTLSKFMLLNLHSKNCKDKSCRAFFSSVKNCSERSTNETVEGHSGVFIFILQHYNITIY